MPGQASVRNFLANFQGGGLRPNRYEIIVTFPGPVVLPLGGARQTASKISFTAKAASIPTSNVGVIDVPYMGRQVKVAGDKTWDDWTVGILLDNDLIGRRAFEIWHDRILGFDSNVAIDPFVNPANYFARAEVHLLDRADRVLDTYTVEGIWPSNVGEVTLGYDQNDSVAEQSVTFAINGWSSAVTT